MKRIAIVLFLICAACRLSGAESSAKVIPGLVMTTIPAGNFMMGTELRADEDNPERNKLTFFYEQPMHQVALDSFQISAYEITQAQYELVMSSANPSHFLGNENLPVDQVQWYGAVIFCNRLSKIARLAPCYNPATWKCDFTKNGFRLPTEAEWMYAAGAGTITRFYTGDTVSELARAAWYSKNSGQSTCIVGQKEPNAWGLYDMHGNVWEWCHDWFSEDYYRNSPVSNPTGPDSGLFRVVRGGGWLSEVNYLRLNCRAYCRPNVRRTDIGFRVARRL